MTTIAISSKHKEIACDLQFSHSSGMKFKGSSKCVVLSKDVAQKIFNCDKAVVGGAGNADNLAKAWTWLSNPELFDKLPKIKGNEFVALVEDGSIYTSMDLVTWLAVDQPYYAIGSGSHLALGALEMGASPKQAVKHASKYDYMTGMGFKSYKV